MTHATIDRAALDTFKASWPCHGLPESLHSITFDFDESGDLVDIVAKARNGRTLDSAAFDGPALVALSQDAAKLAAEPVTPVIFRVDKDGEVTAVFPCAPFDSAGHFMTCYAHVGQHGSCSFEWYYSTRPAVWTEYANLKRELETAPFGYRLKVYQRMTPGHRDAFNAATTPKV